MELERWQQWSLEGSFGEYANVGGAIIRKVFCLCCWASHCISKFSFLPTPKHLKAFYTPPYECSHYWCSCRAQNSLELIRPFSSWPKWHPAASLFPIHHFLGAFLFPTRKKKPSNHLIWKKTLWNEDFSTLNLAEPKESWGQLRNCMVGQNGHVVCNELIIWFWSRGCLMAASLFLPPYKALGWCNPNGLLMNPAIPS